jgi:hypothetical protein
MNIHLREMTHFYIKCKKYTTMVQQYNWNIVGSAVKHHNTNPTMVYKYWRSTIQYKNSRKMQIRYLLTSIYMTGHFPGLAQAHQYMTGHFPGLAQAHQYMTDHFHKALWWSSCLPMISDSLRLPRLLPPLKLVAMI